MLSPSAYTSATLPTGAAVRAYVNTADPTWDVYAELLNPLDLSVKASFPGGTNVFTGYVIEAEIENNMKQDVPRSMKLTLDGTVAPYIDFTSDRVRLSAVALHNGQIILGPVPRGIFGFQQTTEQFFDNGESYYSITGYDDVWDLTMVDFLADYVIPRGFDVSLCAATIMMMDMFTPSEGGRAPAGYAVAGSPQTTSSAGYATVGVLVSSVASLNSVTGYLDSPAGSLGVVSYNRFDVNARCDPTTFAPISPKTATPMLPIPGIGTSYFNDPGLGLWFRPYTGEFVYPFALSSLTGGALPVAVDPFMQPPAPYPAGVQIMQSAYTYGGSPTASVGTAKPPLSTWGRDYDGSGPYFTNTTAALVTVP